MNTSFYGLRWCGVSLSIVLLGGCATLPSSGPTARDITRAQQQLGGFTIVDVDATVLAQALSSQSTGRGQLATLALPGEVDRVGPGDVLQISVYEVGAALFSGRGSSTSGVMPTSGTGEALPQVTVGRDGRITLPWVGRIMAQGKSTDDLSEELSRLYRRNSENPQVLVSIRDNVNNTVVVQGDVRKPGRLPLTLARERVLDAIAIAGGASNPSVDSVVKISRAGESAEQPLSMIEPGSTDDVTLLPQDRVSVAFRPRSFTVLGASGKVAEVPFENVRVSLVEAIGRGGGPSDDKADPAAIFVFRYEPAAFDGEPLPGSRPVAYRLNLRDAPSYFLAQRFEMRPRDVLYIANARANIPTKAIQILNLFFSPFYTARAVTK